jgi:DNA-binding PadR family transcriptional regulator
MMFLLSKNEELILLAIWRLKDNAYGVTIRSKVMEITRRTLHYGSLYNTLDLLMKKKLVTIKESQPQSVRGGRRKKLYFLTDEGSKALKAAFQVYKAAWSSIPDFAFDND